jgi:hypothetical protein
MSSCSDFFSAVVRIFMEPLSPYKMSFTNNKLNTLGLNWNCTVKFKQYIALSCIRILQDYVDQHLVVSCPADHFFSN